MKTKSKGETIVEILIAMTILVMIITSTYVILMRAMKTNTSIKNRVRALNIAREGIEGVRNIRDTNWLRYSGNRRNQWLCRPGLSTIENSTGSNPYSFGTPVSADELYKESVMEDFYLDPTPVDFYLHDCIEDLVSGYYILEYYQRSINSKVPRKYILEPQHSDPSTLNDSANREKFRLYWDKETNRATHASEFYDAPNTTLVLNDESIFYRFITIETAPVFEDPDNPGNCLPIAQDPAPDPSCTTLNLKKLKVTSVVQWDEEGDNKFESVTLETHLYDYFERTSY